MTTDKIRESQFRKAITVLRGGGLVIAPTETFYGILADAYSLKAVKRLVKLKERAYGNPIPLLAGDTITVTKAVAFIPPIFKSLTERFWPGPLTLVLQAAQGLPEGITAGTGSVGIRIPAQSPALDLTKYFRGPLTATSANFTGEPSPRSVRDLDEALVQGVDLVIDGGWTQGGQPSTVLNLTVNPPELIRRGVLGKEILDFLTMRR